MVLIIRENQELEYVSALHLQVEGVVFIFPKYFIILPNNYNLIKILYVLLQAVQFSTVKE